LKSVVSEWLELRNIDHAYIVLESMSRKAAPDKATCQGWR
jgi:hypothetical protein